MKISVKQIVLLIALLGTCLVNPLKVEASVVVQASGDETGKQDYKAISKALEKDGDVILEEGSTYYLKSTLWVGSNQSITATGATIISKTGTFRNKPTKTNYKSISNFTVDGGTWRSE
jgi:hypothetical protein